MVRSLRLGSPLDGSRNFALGFHAGSNLACGSAGKQVAKITTAPSFSKPDLGHSVVAEGNVGNVKRTIGTEDHGCGEEQSSNAVYWTLVLWTYDASEPILISDSNYRGMYDRSTGKLSSVPILW